MNDGWVTVKCMDCRFGGNTGDPAKGDYLLQLARQHHQETGHKVEVNGMSEETRLLKGADEGVCVHAGQVCMEPEGCGCPCSFCLAELDEARRDEDPEDLDLSPEAVQRALGERYGLRAPEVPKRTVTPTAEDLREAVTSLMEKLAGDE